MIINITRQVPPYDWPVKAEVTDIPELSDVWGKGAGPEDALSNLFQALSEHHPDWLAYAGVREIKIKVGNQ